jgi:hypothetical protein
MRASKNARSDIWHLVGNRGCGAEPDDETVKGPWAAVRDRVDRDDADRCKRCRWP